MNLVTSCNRILVGALMIVASVAAQAAPTLKQQVAAALAEGHWVVQEGQWLIQIANALMPDNPGYHSLLMAEVYKRNPKAFFGDSPDNLLPGRRLAIVFPLVEAGRVQATAGDVHAQDLNRATRPLKKGDPTFVGDRIVTAYGTIRLQMLDGETIHIRQQTEFVIENYWFQADQPSLSRNTLRLKKGAIRNVTGRIAKEKNRYRLITPVAHVGIRGTDFGVFVCTATECLLNKFSSEKNYGSGAYVGVANGKVAVGNRSGEHALGKGEFFHVANAEDVPQPIPAPPGFFHHPVTVTYSCWENGKSIHSCRKLDKSR